MSEYLVPFTPPQPVDLSEVATFEVTGPDTAEIAVEYREGVKQLIAAIEAGYKPHIQRAHQAHKLLVAELHARLLPATVALASITQALGAYELGRRQAEERARRQAEVEALEQAQAARAAEAQAARLAGDGALAASIAAAPLEDFVAPVVAAPTPAKTAGVAVTPRWTFEVVDFPALVAYALGVPAVLSLVLQVNEKGVQSLVTQMGEGFMLPGVRRVSAGTTVRSTRR